MNAVKMGSHFLTVSPTAMTQIVAPSANVAGLIIQTASIVTGSSTVNVWAATSAPTSIGDASKPVVFGGNGSSTGGANSQYQMPNPLFIPAGYGLWAMTNSSGGYLSLTWDLLS